MALERVVVGMPKTNTSSGGHFLARIGSSPRRVVVLAEVGLALAGLIWGVNFTLVKAAVERMPPVYYLGLRFLVATVVMLPFCFRRLRGLDRRGWMLGLGLGALLFCGFVLQTVSLKSVSPGMSGFHNRLDPQAMALPAGLGRHSRGDGGHGGAVALRTDAVRHRRDAYYRGQHLLGPAYRGRGIRLHQVRRDYPGPATDVHVRGALSCHGLCLGAARAVPRVGGHRRGHLDGHHGRRGGLLAHGVRPETYGRHSGIGIHELVLGYDVLTVRNAVGFALVFLGTIVARMGSHKTSDPNAEVAPSGP
jgi:hypothetical protein